MGTSKISGKRRDDYVLLGAACINFVLGLGVIGVYGYLFLLLRFVVTETRRVLGAG